MDPENLIGRHVKIIKTNHRTEEAKYYILQDYFGSSPYRAILKEINGKEKIELPLPKVIEAIKNSKTIKY